METGPGSYQLRTIRAAKRASPTAGRPTSTSTSGRGLAPEELAAEVLTDRFSPRRKLGFVGLGRSTGGRHAIDDGEMLAEGFGR